MSSSPARYARTIARLARMALPPALEQADAEEDEPRDDEEHDAHRGGARGVVGLDLAEDVDRRDLGVERPVAADEDHRAELPDGAREAHPRAGEDRRHEVREDDAAERRRLGGPERR